MFRGVWHGYFTMACLTKSITSATMQASIQRFTTLFVINLVRAHLKTARFPSPTLKLNPFALLLTACRDPENDNKENC